MKKLILLLGLAAVGAMAQTCPNTVVTSQTGHYVCLSWGWTQGSGAAASQFNVMRSASSGGCAQIAPVPPATVPTFPAGCTQIAPVPVTQFNYVDQGNATTNILTEARTYCYVIVAQGSTGAISPDSNEVCLQIPLVPPAAPSGLTGVAK